MKKNRTRQYIWVLILFLSLACEPVFAIGWQEFLLLMVLLGILLGSPLYRFFRRMEEFWKTKKRDE
jgi:hypothetical protein